MAKKKEENKVVQAKTISLDCKLTDVEVMEYGQELAEKSLIIVRNNVELAAETEAFKEIKKRIESQNNTLRADQSDLSKAISTGIVERPVDCEALFDYELGRITVRRLDTDEVIEDREMVGVENQMALAFEDEPKPTSAVVACNDCDGTGIDQDTSAVCDHCNGAGELEISVTEPDPETDAETETGDEK